MTTGRINQIGHGLHHGPVAHHRRRTRPGLVRATPHRLCPMVTRSGHVPRVCRGDQTLDSGATILHDGPVADCRSPLRRRLEKTATRWTGYAASSRGLNSSDVLLPSPPFRLAPSERERVAPRRKVRPTNGPFSPPQRACFDALDDHPRNRRVVLSRDHEKPGGSLLVVTVANTASPRTSSACKYPRSTYRPHQPRRPSVLPTDRPLQ